MARSLNKVMLIGHLGADPELRYTPSGVPVATFRIATNETWRDADGNMQEKTEWFTIVVWRKLAELSNDLLKKGSRVYVEGRLQTRTYEDRNGIRRTVTEIVADDIILLEPKGATSEATPQVQQKATPPSIQPEPIKDETEIQDVDTVEEELKDLETLPEELEEPPQESMGESEESKDDEDLPF